MVALNALDTARIILDELISSGTHDAVLAPGSRSAPFAYALAEREYAGSLRVHVRTDERVAAFTALGLSLSTHRPVPVITTSGTAVGELMPAVMEASHAGVRLVVLSADRPEELRGTGSNQTTRQAGLFSQHTRAAIDLPAEPEDPDELVSLVRAAVALGGGTTRDPAGPVQINVAFREPLTPAPGWSPAAPDSSSGHDGDAAAALPLADAAAPQNASFSAALESARSQSGTPPQPAADSLPSAQLQAVRASHADAVAAEPVVDIEIEPEARATRRSVVLAGHGAGEAAAFFAQRHGLPLLAEPSSNARFGASAIPAYRTVLAEFAERIERVVVFGRPTLSRPVARLMSAPGIEQALYLPSPAPWFEPGRRSDRQIAHLTELGEFAGYGPAGWLEDWQEAGADAEARIQGVLSEEDERLAGIHVADAVWECSDGNLVVGASNIIRDLDLVASPGWHPLDVYSNRGLAGIDGTLSTAMGVALGSAIPTRAVMGDLTFLHDAGALLAVPGEAAPDLQVVVLNDGGGRIFGLLEHGAVGRASEAARLAVERYFGTPQEADLAGLCAGYGVRHTVVTDVEGLFEALEAQPCGISVLEVRVDLQRAVEIAGLLA